MGGSFLLLGIAIGASDHTTYAWILLVLGGLGMLVYGLSKRRELDFDRPRTRRGRANA